MRFWSTLLALAVFGIATVSSAQSLKPGEELSSISVLSVAQPDPVLGADGRIHLAYELLVANTSRLFMTIDKVEAVNADASRLWSQDGDALAAMMTVYGGEGRRLSPGGSAIIFMDVSVNAGETLPAEVLARLTVTRELAGPDGKPAPFPETEPLPATVAFTGVPSIVGTGARVVEPPLRGTGWIAVNGCCDAVTSHRGAVMAVNGLLRVPERFAIDWIKLDAAGRVFEGDAARLPSYRYYGETIHSVAPGVVVNLYDAADEQVPGQDAKGITTENIGGNMVVVDIGDGAFAFYAHMQRGSLTVKLGDRVAAGQVLGLLGNTGNSTAPHLHFHIMDGPSPLDANSLPYVFSRFTGRGVVEMDGENDPIEKGAPAVIDPSRLVGAYEKMLPLNNQLVDFGD